MNCRADLDGFTGSVRNYMIHFRLSFGVTVGIEMESDTDSSGISFGDRRLKVQVILLYATDHLRSPCGLRDRPEPTFMTAAGWISEWRLRVWHQNDAFNAQPT